MIQCCKKEDRSQKLVKIKGPLHVSESLFIDLSNNDNQAKASVSPKDKTSTIRNTKWTKKMCIYH